MQLKKSLITFIRTKYLILLLLLLSAAVFATLIFLSSTFKVRNIIINNKQEQIFGLESVKNRNLLFLSTKSVEDTIFQRNSNIADITATKKLPETIELDVTFYKPIAYLETKAGFIQLSNAGRILLKQQKVTKKLPIIKYYQSVPYQTLQAGQFITYKDILYSLYFTEKLNDLGMAINNVDITGFYMLRLNSNKSQSFVTTTDKDRELQSMQLEKVIKQFKLKGQEFTSIDVRFDKPIVSF